MMKFEDVPLELCHVQELVNISREATEQGISGLSPELFETYQIDGLTFLADGEPWAAGGIVRVSPGLGMALVFVKAVPPEYGTRVLRFIRRTWETLINRSNYRRIEMLVLSDFTLSKRMVEFLGFRYCCTKELYGPCGESFDSYYYLP